jgi:hypothetical protein
VKILRARVRVALVRDSSNGPTQLSLRKARRLDKEGQCWRTNLPRHLDAATSLDIRVSYGRAGDAGFALGIAHDRPNRRRKTLVDPSALRT